MNIHTMTMSITTLLVVAGAGCAPEAAPTSADAPAPRTPASPTRERAGRAGDQGATSATPRPRPGQKANQADASPGAPALMPTPAPSGATSTAELTGVIEHGDDGKIYMRLGGGGGRGADERQDVLVTPPTRASGCARVRWAGERPDFENIASVLSLQMKLRERAGATRMGAPAGDRAAYKAWQAEGSATSRTIARQGLGLLASSNLSLMEVCARLKREHALDYIEVIESFHLSPPHVREVIRFVYAGAFLRDIDPNRPAPVTPAGGSRPTFAPPVTME